MRMGDAHAVSSCMMSQMDHAFSYIPFLPQPLMNEDSELIPVLRCRIVQASAACLPLSRSLGEKRREFINEASIGRLSHASISLGREAEHLSHWCVF